MTLPGPVAVSLYVIFIVVSFFSGLYMLASLQPAKTMQDTLKAGAVFVLTLGCIVVVNLLSTAGS